MSPLRAAELAMHAKVETLTLPPCLDEVRKADRADRRLSPRARRRAPSP